MSDPDLDDDVPRRGCLADFVRTWLPAILAVLAIRTYVFEPFRIPSGSMAPTLEIGDQVVVNKASYGLWVPASLVEIFKVTDEIWVPPRMELINWGDPERGDIIVFRWPRNTRVNYIKRVVGIPGDRIRVKNNQVFLNDEPQPMVYQDRFNFVDDQCNSASMKRHLETIGEVDHEVLTKAGFAGRLRDMSEKTVPEGHVFVMGDNRDNSEDSRAWGFVSYDKIKGKAHFVWFSWNSCPQGDGSVRGDRIFHGLYSLND
ncbi:MAG: signal peptidase I [Myxococcales bacterium]|nr:signal peptidase I [Myxococcales bacterium]